MFTILFQHRFLISKADVCQVVSLILKLFHKSICIVVVVPLQVFCCFVEFMSVSVQELEVSAV